MNHQAASSGLNDVFTNGRIVKLLLFCALGDLLVFSVNRLVTGFGFFTPWLFFDFAFVGIWALGMFACCNSIPWTFLTQAIFISSFTLANSLKLRFRSIPILASDFLLLKDTFTIMPPFMRILAVGGAGIFFLLCVWAIFGALFSKNSPPWTARRVLLLIPVFVFLTVNLVMPGLYFRSFDDLFSSQDFNIPILLKEKEATIGPLFTFSIEAARFLDVRTFTPGLETVRGAVARLRQLAGPQNVSKKVPLKATKSPNIYVILVESFWDPSTFLGSMPGSHNMLDPGFKNLWIESGSRWFLSPMMGGGTANVEFEVLCGLPSRAVTRGMVFQVAISNNMPCLP